MSVFHFQQFSVVQEKSAMKVCTDATLFGAMAPMEGNERVLDIGAGTGLLALMTAQLGASHVTAVELTREAFEEASENFRNSPWSDRLEAVHQDIQGFAAQTEQQYDLINSNPPFFDRHSKTAEELRTLARHTDQLPYDELLHCADKLLSENGLLYVLLPTHAVERFLNDAGQTNLYPTRQTNFRGYSHNEAKVAALTLKRTPSPYQPRLLTIYSTHRVYSEESKAFLSPFLLRFRKEG